MPCRSDYPELNNIESALTTIYNVYDDLANNYKQFKYPHNKIYEFTCDLERLNIETNKLCKILQGKSKNELANYNFMTQRWWLNHQISDFKRLIKESKKNRFGVDINSYETELLNAKSFLFDIMEDTNNKVANGLDKFNANQNAKWQKNITRHNFVQVLSSFELFSELVYLKVKGKEIEDAKTFKNYEESLKIWELAFNESFKDWISYNDQFELKRYYEKYNQVVYDGKKAMNYFDSLPLRTATNQNLVFTINENLNLMRILKLIRFGILKKLD